MTSGTFGTGLSLVGGAISGMNQPLTRLRFKYNNYAGSPLAGRVVGAEGPTSQKVYYKEQWQSKSRRTMSTIGNVVSLVGTMIGGSDTSSLFGNNKTPGTDVVTKDSEKTDVTKPGTPKEADFNDQPSTLDLEKGYKPVTPKMADFSDQSGTTQQSQPDYFQNHNAPVKIDLKPREIKPVDMSEVKKQIVDINNFKGTGISTNTNNDQLISNLSNNNNLLNTYRVGSILGNY